MTNSQLHASRRHTDAVQVKEIDSSVILPDRPVVLMHTHIETEDMLEDEEDNLQSISNSVIEESHPECKFCCYCFGKMADKREIV